jgi:cyclic pyranopterin phosphate synthase
MAPTDPLTRIPTDPLAHHPAYPLADRYSRPLRSLRISVTDRCNMRCRYCMPEQDYIWLPRESILCFEEVDRLVGIFITLGVNKVRLTGGEPLLRHNLSTLVNMLRHRRLDDMALTTNGILLAPHAAGLKAAGLGRVTVSLDTLRAERMVEFARSPRHGDVLEGITSARAAGLGVKLNVVVIRGYNDDELVDLIEYGRHAGLEVRFIEYMDVGGATGWTMDQVVTRQEILGALEKRYGRIEPMGSSSAAPAERFALADGTWFGIIASTTAPFCRTCDRSRLTADGTLLLCLYTESGLDLREALRLGASDNEIAERVREVWSARTDRGAEARAEAPGRGVLYPLESLRADPRREMHTRGG